MSEASFIENLRWTFEKNSLSEYLTKENEEKFYSLFRILVEYNEKVNLTAITDEDGVILKHFADSLAFASRLAPRTRLIDIGCGGGFPSLPIAIVRKDVNIMGVDSVGKKVNFVNYAAAELDLGNLSALSARAEELSREKIHRERFDYACARAVSRLSVISEYCIPFLKVGGKFFAMKADSSEIDESKNAFKLLNSSVSSVDSFELCAKNGEIMNRCIIEITKDAPISDKYPRNNSAISKSPL